MEDKNDFILLSGEEQMKLPKAEFLKYYRKQEAHFRAKQTEIAPNYDQKNFNEKVDFWAGRMNQGMRWQADSGLDPYAGYSAEWRENILCFEPNFDTIIEEAFERFLSWEWNHEEYLNRVRVSNQTSSVIPDHIQQFIERITERVNQHKVNQEIIFKGPKKSLWQRLFGSH